MRIKVDAQLCSGQGRCYTVSPELFQSDDEGFVRPERHRVRRRARGRGCGGLAVGVVPRGCDQRGRRDVNTAVPSTDVDVVRLADTAAVVDVCVRNARALDGRDWELLATCFADDVVVEFEGVEPLHGPAAVVDVCRAALEPLDASQHLLGNHHVTRRRRLGTQRVLRARPARARRARPGRQVRRRRHLPRHLGADVTARGRSRAAVCRSAGPTATPTSWSCPEIAQPRIGDRHATQTRIAARQRRVRHRGRGGQGAGVGRGRPAVRRVPDGAQGRDRAERRRSTRRTAGAR